MCVYCNPATDATSPSRCFAPKEIGFMVYKSFMTYTSGVYQKEWYEIKPAGGHAVKIVGCE